MIAFIYALASILVVITCLASIGLFVLSKEVVAGCETTKQAGSIEHIDLPALHAQMDRLGEHIRARAKLQRLI